MPERHPFERWKTQDLLWLGAVFALLICSGFGFRDPWPADEPRFAAIARDMVHGGEWLFPRVGGDLYQDKPPLFFWLQALAYSLIGNVRWSFLLPSLLSAGATVLLVFDMARRLAGRQAGLIAAMILLCTVQFITTMRSGQIDATLCLMTTLSLYGLLRHVFWGPQWGWYFLGGIAAGLGIITKGVGFLPMLILVPYGLLLRFRWVGLASIAGGWRWALAPVGMLLAVALWLAPMLIAVASKGSADYTAYRNEILFQQTVTRYAAAWHHLNPWYFFIVEVLPALWMPWSLLLVWLVPRWRTAWRQRDARVWLPLMWVLLVLLFFSLSPGKRGLYITPALPALAMAASPFVVSILARQAVRRAGIAISVLVMGGAVLLSIAHASGMAFALKALNAVHLASTWPLHLFIILAAAGVIIAWRTIAVLAWPVTLATLAVIWSYAIAPSMNGERSGADFIRAAQLKLQAGETLGLVAYKEQFLLYVNRPIVNFGHRRSLEGLQEIQDAAAWLAQAPDRVLLVPESALNPCFTVSATQIAGRASGGDWYLVRGTPAAGCLSNGHVSRAIRYVPLIK
jgi:4-amino-4-deoxy-L-arabinose transferase-like glycosyltransferase